MRADDDIKRDVEAELRWDRDIDATDIGVAVKNGVVTLTGFVRSYLQKYDAERDAKRVSGVLAVANDLEVRLPTVHQKPDPEIAREVGADAAVYSAVHRFVQRKGSALSVESPASVEYRALVVDAASGVVIGNYLFDFTQQPLAADLTTLPDFLQGGGKWRTREEILDASLTKTANKIKGTLLVSAP